MTDTDESLREKREAEARDAARAPCEDDEPEDHEERGFF